MGSNFYQALLPRYGNFDYSIIEENAFFKSSLLSLVVIFLKKSIKKEFKILMLKILSFEFFSTISFFLNCKNVYNFDKQKNIKLITLTAKVNFLGKCVFFSPKFCNLDSPIKPGNTTFKKTITSIKCYNSFKHSNSKIKQLVTNL